MNQNGILSNLIDYIDIILQYTLSIKEYQCQFVRFFQAFDCNAYDNMGEDQISII